MDYGTAFIINAAPGVGKSTLLKNIQNSLPANIIKHKSGGAAVIDGDDMGRIIPLINSPDWLNAMQDNIADCCRNYKNYGFLACIIGFVFPSDERINRLNEKLRNYGFETVTIILDCADDELQQRLIKRNTSRLINLEQALEINRKVKSMNADFRLDVTKLAEHEVNKKICAYIKRRCAIE